MTVTTAPSHGRHKPNPSYPSNIREFARRLYDDGEYTAYGIRKALIKRGVRPVPSENTILCWVDPDYREARRASERRGGRPGPKRARAWEARLDRMRELRRLRISYRQIAALVSHDFDLEIGTEQVRSILKGETRQATIKRLWPDGASS